MSYEEDFLMRRVREISDALKEKGVLEECSGIDGCGTAYAVGLKACPNCGKPLEESEQTGDRNVGAGAGPAEQQINADQTPGSGGTAGDAPRYQQLTQAKLKAELDDRKVFYPPAATKPDLIKLLEKDDREKASRLADTGGGDVTTQDNTAADNVDTSNQK